LFWGGNNCNFGFGLTGADDLSGNLRGTGATNYFWNTVGVFRDPSAWYHVVLAVDTTQATDTNRLKLYVNGIQQTLSASYCPQNTAQLSTAQRNIGSESGRYYFDGYLAEVNFIDGQQLTPSSFGAFNIYGVWQPAKYQGTYGTNGFYLKFDSYATAAALGTDSSGNSNTWTVNNISVTAGATYDAMTDVPTLTGLGAANYSVMNPLSFDESAYRTITDANLTVSFTATGNTSFVPGTIYATTGKWYAEFVWNGTGNLTQAAVGISTSNYHSYYLGNSSTNGTSYAYRANGNKIGNGSAQTAYGATYTTGDVIGVAFDADAGTLEFYKNNTSQGVAYTGLTGLTSTFAVGAFGSCSVACNFGQRPFTYTPPTGFVALNTFSLSAPPIPNGATVMAATTYTGDGTANRVISGLSFTPDFIWIKNRSSTWDNILGNYLVVAGTNTPITLVSNSTAAQVDGGYIGTQTTNSLKLATSAGENRTNGNTLTYVAWSWAANGAGVSNTSGSITSTVSAGTTQGFSVVTYTGTGANATVGHGLGVAPSMIIVKARSFAGADWNVYHSSTGNTGRLFLDTTAAFQTVAVWNNTSPTSSVFTVGGAYSDVNSNTQTYVAYCFAAVAGYSAFGSYTGNGSTDGPFVYLGFRPRFTLIKRTDAIANWRIHDTARDTYNVASKTLYPNLSNAETSAASEYWDILSNGIKLRTSDAESNASGGTYIYACFAENPFKYSLAR